MLGMEQRCDVVGCDKDADAYGDGELVKAYIADFLKVAVWLCPKHYHLYIKSPRCVSHFMK